MAVIQVSAGWGSGQQPHQATHDWPEHVFVQGGLHGLVWTRDGGYYTAFVEAFLDEPRGFVRGEGETLEAAEQACWERYRTVVACHPGHEFERRGRTDGYAWCMHCGIGVADALRPTTTCVVCGCVTADVHDVRGEVYCSAHLEAVPIAFLDDMHLDSIRLRRNTAAIGHLYDLTEMRDRGRICRVPWWLPEYRRMP